jgi:hypothetical protein
LRSTVRLAACLALGFLTAAAATPNETELRKASVIARVARFIEWPAAEPPFVLCLTADHPQRVAVRHVFEVENEKIAEQSVTVRELRPQDSLVGCRVLFLAPRDTADLERFRRESERHRIMLFAEGEFARAGVHVAYVLDRGRTRFEVRRRGLEAIGLKAGFRLLEQAKVVD